MGKATFRRRCPCCARRACTHWVSNHKESTFLARTKEELLGEDMCMAGAHERLLDVHDTELADGMTERTDFLLIALRLQLLQVLLERKDAIAPGVGR